jgi:hypothetical protein
MKRVLGFSLVTALILASVHVVANPKTPAKLATKTSAKVAAAKGNAKRLPATCPTCVSSVTYPADSPIPPGIEVPGSKHNYTRCVDFDNIAPGHCCSVPGRNVSVVSRETPHITVGFYTIYWCKKATPGPDPCGSPTHPPFMANPIHISQQQYWGTAGNGGFSLPYFRKSIVKTNENENASCKCSVPTN